MKTRKLLLPIALFVLAGIPLVAYLWDTANRVFAGDIDIGRIGIALVAAALFVVLLRMLARTVTRWEEQRVE
jgi:hypothetical protein